MKVFFDYAIFTLQRFGGVSNYIVNLAENFSDQVDPLIISLFYKNHYLKKSNFADKLIYYNRIGSLIKYVNKANKVYFDYKLRNKNPDIIHQTYFSEKNFYTSKAKKVVTEYDLIKEKFYSERLLNNSSSVFEKFPPPKQIMSKFNLSLFDLA